jgi:hypothetical protein
MELPDIPQDDIMDVMEMTSKIESYISYILKDNEKDLAMSALMSASINCMLSQCKTLNEVLFYRNLFMQILDSSIIAIQVNGPEKPQSF